MFAKKLLSIVGLLFIGSRITSVNAEGIESCGTAGVTITGCEAQTGTATGVCIDGNKIYTYAEDTKSTCYVSESSLASGVHVLTVEEATVTDVEFSAVDTTANTNYLLYICDDSKCDITNGFVKGKNDAYIKIISGETAGEDASTSLDASDKADCTPGTIFKDKDEDSAIKFCIAAGHGEALAANAAATKNYIVTKSEPLTDDTEAKTDMVVQFSDKAFVLNTIYTDDEYCVYGTNEIQNRIANFCEGTILDNMYTCENGLCSKRDSPITAGNYIVKSGTDFNLYKCETDTGSTTVTCNVDNGAEDNGILLVKEESNTKEYTFQKVYATSILSTVDLTTDSLFIYDCVDGTCKPTEALIRAGAVPATAYCGGTDKCAITGTETITITNIGAISYESNFIMTPTQGNAVNIDSGKSYAYAGTENAFAVIKNVGDVIVAKAQILGETIYVNEDGTLATDAEYTACGSTIKQYTSVDTTTNTATAGADCEPPAVECELSANGDENEHCVEGYYLKSTATGNNNGLLVKTGEETGTLYHCNGAKQVCTIVNDSEFKPGFYKNVDVISRETVQYIKCPTLATCTAVAVTDNTCNDAKVGGLIISEGETPKFSICIDDASNAVELSDGEVKVFISIDTEDGKGADAFGTKTANSFVLLDIGVNCLKNDSDELPYRYSGPNQVLVRRTDNVRGDICEYQNTMKEFKKGVDNIYTN